MPDVKRTVKLITTQQIVEPSASPEDPPTRKWTIQVLLAGPGGEDVQAGVFDKVTYLLHETFGDRQKQTFTKPPFKITEQGWGEFDMVITLHAPDKGGEFQLQHDLNFQDERYEAEHKITFKQPKPALIEKLRESGPVPGDANGVKGREEPKKKKRNEKGVDMDKLAESLQKLNEDDLLTVVQMIHDSKSDETYVKNDVDAGEFHVDLYTLPDNTVKELWGFSQQKLQR